MSARQNLVQLFIRDTWLLGNGITSRPSRASRAINPLWINVLPFRKVFEVAFTIGCVKFAPWIFSATTYFGGGHVVSALLLVSMICIAFASYARASEKQATVGILLASTDPVNEHRIRGQLEIRHFMEALNGGMCRDEFDARTITSCRPADLVEQMEEHNPRLVQISGHGHPDGILFEGENGESRQMGGQNLIHIFRRASQRGLQVVVLNSCHSNTHTQQLARIIGCTVGICGQISDDDSITFTSRLWSSLSKGVTIECACEIAASSIGFELEIVAVP